MKDLIKQHKDTLSIIGSIIVAAVSLTWFLSDRINGIETRLTAQITEVDRRLGEQIHGIDRRLTAVETILIMQGAPVKALSTSKELDNP